MPAVLPDVIQNLEDSVTHAWVERLASSECPAFTARRKRRHERSGANQDPIVWQRAEGYMVWDVSDRPFVDLTAGFGVMAAGHHHLQIVSAVTQQMNRLVHGLGDVYPSDVKIELMEKLVALSGIPNAKVILGTNGSDAIEAAIKTSLLSTGRKSVLTFERGYHGLSLGALRVMGYSQHFQKPFSDLLEPSVTVMPLAERTPADTIETESEQSFREEQQLAIFSRTLSSARSPFGAVLLEPVIGRGGVLPWSRRFLEELITLAHQHGALVIFDEIWTGFGRCGEMLISCGLDVDLICAGKALGGGFPISACIGKDAVMAAWADHVAGEALHTATFFGHPLSCRASLASLKVIEDEGLVARSKEIGARFRSLLAKTLGPKVHEVRGQGLAIAVEVDPKKPGSALPVVRRCLERGYIVLPAGPDATGISLSPPLTIEMAALEAFAQTLRAVV